MIERIKKLMEIKGLKGTQLAVAIGLPKNAISEWNSGKARPGTDAIIKLANYFGVTTDFLLFGHDPAPKDLTPDQQELLQLWDKLDAVGKAEVRGYLKAKTEKIRL